MKRPVRLLLGCVVFAFFVLATERAAHYEALRGGDAYANTAPEQRWSESGVDVTGGELYQGRTIRWWARRAVQARKDANARGRTIRRLRAELAASGPSWQWLANAECVHNKEGSWQDPHPPYWGGMQADLAFMRAYGPAYLRRWGTADRWPMWAQLHMAYRGWVRRGWQPWPQTSRACGLR